jgi:hypothetical protein
MSTFVTFRLPATSMKVPWLASTPEDPAKIPEGAGFVIGDKSCEPCTKKLGESEEVGGGRMDSCTSAFRL